MYWACDKSIEPRLKLRAGLTSFLDDPRLKFHTNGSEGAAKVGARGLALMPIKLLAGHGPRTVELARGR